MATWAEHYAAADRQARRAAADAVLRARHAAFDQQALDQHHKHDRPQFAVVGEGTLHAQEAYRAGYERIFGLPSRRLNASSSARPSSTRGVGAAG